jgi:serine/threonine protein kinase
MSEGIRVGRYKLLDEIASGGMASIHVGRLVEAHGFSRTVAIKRLHPQFAKDPQFVAMFIDEARLAARIKHPNVVPTLDIVSTDDELFLVMEYVPGTTLARLLSATAQLGEKNPVAAVCGAMVGVLHGLHAAHEATSDDGAPLALVHRDVSPQNVLLGAEGVPRLIDFGVAKAVGRIQTTRDGQLKGKLAYMSPEQLHSLPVDRRADIYAAAVMLWEALVGARLFAGDSEGATIGKVLSAPVDPPSVARPGLGDGFDACVMRGLARDRDARFATAKEMAIALQDAAGRGGLASAHEIGVWVERLAHDDLADRAARITELESARSSRGGPIAAAREPDVSTVTVAQTNEATHRSKRPIAWTAGALALAAGTAAVLGLARTPASSSSSAPGAVVTESESAPPVAATVATASPAPLPLSSNAPSPTTSPATSSTTPPRPPMTRRAAPRSSASPSSCDPPFTYVDGIKTYKPWCYPK